MPETIVPRAQKVYKWLAIGLAVLVVILWATKGIVISDKMVYGAVAIVGIYYAYQYLMQSRKKDIYGVIDTVANAEAARGNVIDITQMRGDRIGENEFVVHDNNTHTVYSYSDERGVFGKEISTLPDKRRQVEESKISTHLALEKKAEEKKKSWLEEHGLVREE